MEDLKEKLPMVIAVIVAIVICVTGLYFFENYKSIYYTQIRELKEDAFLKLEVKTFGVHSWEEVQYNELPEKVQTNYTK